MSRVCVFVFDSLFLQFNHSNYGQERDDRDAVGDAGRAGRRPWRQQHEHWHPPTRCGVGPHVSSFVTCDGQVTCLCLC